MKIKRKENIIEYVCYILIQCLLWCHLQIIYAQNLGREKTEGFCQIYNSTECAEFFKGQYVYMEHTKPLHKQEKRLKRWFKTNKKSGQISRECWHHAKALTCRQFYPKCNTIRQEPDIRPLCTEDCNYVKEICKGEYKRALHTAYYQEYFPLCDDALSIFGTNYCSHLQTYNPAKGPVLFAESHKHTRKSAGETVVLKCYFGIRNFLWNRKSKGMIREGTWLRDNKRVTDNRRISIKTRSKGKARLCMLMKIDSFSVKDQGTYQCEITFANQTIRSSARLSMKPGRVVPVVVEKKVRQITSKDKNNKIEIDNKVPNQMLVTEGRCVQYTGGVCSEYLGNTEIYEQNLQPMNILNKQLENVINVLKNSKKLSKKCETFGQAVLCYHQFPRCHAGGIKYSQSLCKTDCHAFTDEYCKEELASLKNGPGAMVMFIPQCDELPSNDNECIPIIKNHVEDEKKTTVKNEDGEENNPKPSKNKIHDQVDKSMNCYDEGAKTNYIGTLSMTHNGKFCDKWNQYPGYEAITHEYCRNFNDNKPWCYSSKKKVYCELKPCQNVITAPACFVGKGEEYRGGVSVSATGRKCLQWNRVTPLYSNVDHAYCRNFLGDYNEPWCYVERGIREPCSVPRCNTFRSESGDNDKQSNSLITMVVPSIFGSSVVLFLVILLVFYWKNKKLLRHKKNNIQGDDIVDVTSTEQLSTDIEMPKTNTLSTNASFDFKKDIIPHQAPPQEFTFVPSSLPATPPYEMRQQKRFKKSAPEVKEACLSNLVKIGDGKIGQLWQGFFQQSRDKSIPVLVRKLKTDTRSCIISDFRQEMNALRCLKHSNIEQIVCVSLMSEVPFMAFDGQHKTDLKEHIFNNDDVTTAMLLSYISQISAGLEYLHHQKVLHKDLAARNCFITPSGVVYISKSGLGMYRYPNDYVNITGVGLSPVRWMSPETLKSGIYRVPTDVYMFGVLIWELFSYGERPYDEFDDNDSIQEILNENKLICPGTCPVQVWNVVEQCWIVPGCQRPSVTWIRRNIRVLTAEKVNVIPV